MCMNAAWLCVHVCSIERYRRTCLFISQVFTPYCTCKAGFWSSAQIKYYLTSAVQCHLIMVP
jgi:hypothetical protein